MGNDEQWDLKMPPARYLLHHRRGGHGDLAQRLVKTDLDKTRRRRLTILRLSLIAFNVLCRQLGRDMKEGTALETAAKEWIRECLASVTSRLGEETLDLWLLCGSVSAMDQETKRRHRSSKPVLHNTSVTAFLEHLKPSRYTRLFGNLEECLRDTSRCSGDESTRRRRKGRSETIRRRHLSGAETGGSGAPQGYEDRGHIS